MNSEKINILAIGDIFGKPGRSLIRHFLPQIVSTWNIDVVIANGENSAGGLGISPKTAQEIFSAGVHVITTGNHIWSSQHKSDQLLKYEPAVLRPANYPAENPGREYYVHEHKGIRIGVINLMGRLFMSSMLDCPFHKFDDIYRKHSKEWDILVVDFHAEATSEKLSFAYYVKDRTNFIFGTHTHIPTDDLTLLGPNCLYISDIGMTGPYDSVIGLDKDVALKTFLISRREKISLGKRDNRLYAIVAKMDIKNRVVEDFEKIQIFALDHFPVQ